MREPLSESNFLLHAMHHYDNPQCHSLEEFEDDLKKFVYLKKLIYRYKNVGELRERLILNHIIVLFNIFGEETTRMLFFKLEQPLWPQLVTFLVYLNRMPEELPEFGIRLADVKLDETIISVLRKI
jgi:hypothetical protein